MRTYVDVRQPIALGFVRQKSKLPMLEGDPRNPVTAEAPELNGET
jgi:hypothetical protein